MPNYEEIYDRTFAENTGYQNWIGSPGVRLVFLNQDQIQRTGKKHLDYGCGAGFVVELMRSYVFEKESYGVDVSSEMCKAANSRLGGEFALKIEDKKGPFPDDNFDIITCFDVLEHVDEEDVEAIKADIMRLLAPGGVFFCNISLKPSVSVDHNGENLHRTVKPASWWDDIFAFDSFDVQKSRMEMTAWKRV